MCNSSEGGSGGKCWKQNITYSLECQICKIVNDTLVIYHGESSRSGFSRGLEHGEGLEKKTDGNPLWKHCRDKHNSDNLTIDNFTMKLTGTYRGPLRRQTAEGCFISNSIKKRDKERQKIVILNSRSQFHQPGIVKLKATSNEYE